MKTYITALALMLALLCRTGTGLRRAQENSEKQHHRVTSGGGNTVTVGKSGNGSTTVKDNNGNTVTVGGKGHHGG